MIRQQQEHLFVDNAPLSLVDVVDLVLQSSQQIHIIAINRERRLTHIKQYGQLMQQHE